MFRALVIDKQDDAVTTTLREVSDTDLPAGEVTVRVAYSTLNYKDALAVTKGAPVVRRFPMVPGIDFAGVVESSSDPRWREGDRVVLNGWGVGEGHWGGLAGRARVSGDWLIALPSAFTLRQAMAIGTAGYTAALCVLAFIRQGILPAHGPVLVTGAAGGVGSIAVAMLARRGYRVAAVTGRAQEAAFLKTLGAHEVLDRRDFEAAGKPLEKERWAGAVDVAGGQILANVCAQMQYDGVVCACGLAAGLSWPATVAPFILRGVTLVGINSVLVPIARRIDAWSCLAQDLDPGLLESLTEEIGLDDVTRVAPDLLAGRVRGRLVVRVDETVGAD